MVRIGVMRVVAALIDCLICGIPAAIIQLIVLLVIGHGFVGVVAARLIGSAIVLGYFYMEVMNGQAIGKKIFKYQITDQNGGPASQQALMKRYLIKMSGVILGVVTVFLSVIPIIGLLVALVNVVVGLTLLIMGLMLLRPNCLAYWDELCGTAVFGPGVAPAGFAVMPPVPNPVATTPPPPPPVG